MQYKLRYGLFTIIISFVVVCRLAFAQAEESNASKKNTPTPASVNAPASTTTSKSAKTLENTTATKSGTTNPGKVASVNGTVISQEQFDNALNYQKEIASIRGVTVTDEQMPELKYEVLDNLISAELLSQESQKSGIKIEEKEIDESYEAQKQKGQFKTDAEFEDALKQSNKSIESYRAEIKQGLAIDRFIKNKFTDKTVVPDSEAKKYYDDNPSYFQKPAQVRVSHIMISAPSNADQSVKDEARNKIEEVMKRLRTGDTFENLVNEVSDDTSSKDNGGDLGYLSRGQAPQSFMDAAFALKKGEISDIVQTSSGYHVIKLTDKTAARTISYEEAKNDIIDNLKSSKVNSAVSNYITILKNRSTIETYPISK